MGCDTNEVDLRKPDPIAALKSWLNRDDVELARESCIEKYGVPRYNGPDGYEEARVGFMRGHVNSTADARTLVRAAVAAYEAEIARLKPIEEPEPSCKRCNDSGALTVLRNAGAPGGPFARVPCSCKENP